MWEVEEMGVGNLTLEEDIEPPNVSEAEIEVLSKLGKKDVRSMAKKMGKNEARSLVRTYYIMQGYRTATANQVRAAGKFEAPSEVLELFSTQFYTLEWDIKRVLDAYTDTDPLGIWTKSIHGIGPVIAAGLLAHIDITKAPTAGHIWSFAGLDPTKVWQPHTKRAWNAELKKICWFAGDSFLKHRGRKEDGTYNPKDVYGHYIDEEREYYNVLNEQGVFKEQAAEILKAKNFRKDTEAYKWYSQGKLPPAHILARAKRWSVKMFLSHYHYAAYWLEYDKEPPQPYVIEHGGHVHFIEPPNKQLIIPGKTA